MAGGEYPDGSASKAVYRYDPTLDVWQEVESMQTPRSELGIYSKCNKGIRIGSIYTYITVVLTRNS